ncbi:Uncharacterised protein [Mycobacteroides abscessus subsp. abscessus]|nr:Uncharacterised protein [Mycobacteroides abscessus subsp. abscessus]
MFIRKTWAMLARLSMVPNTAVRGTNSSSPAITSTAPSAIS